MEALELFGERREAETMEGTSCGAAGLGKAAHDHHEEKQQGSLRHNEMTRRLVCVVAVG